MSKGHDIETCREERHRLIVWEMVNGGHKEMYPRDLICEGR